jgi:hypothetical protein
MHFVGMIPALAMVEAGKQAGVIHKDSKIEKMFQKVGTWVHAIKEAVKKVAHTTTEAAVGGMASVVAKGISEQARTEYERMDKVAKEHIKKMKKIPLNRYFPKESYKFAENLLTTYKRQMVDLVHHHLTRFGAS